MELLDLVPASPRPTTALDYWREHRIDTIVWPHSWAKRNPSYPLTWQKLRFSEANKDHVPEHRGIYSFVVSIENNFLPTHGHIVYVGITGDEGDRTLRARYKDYLYERKKGSKRPRIKTMFELWGEHLDFWFAPCPDRSLDLAELEREINTMLLPPFVEKDFEPWARPLIKILRTN